MTPADYAAAEAVLSVPIPTRERPPCLHTDTTWRPVRSLSMDTMAEDHGRVCRDCGAELGRVHLSTHDR